MSKRHLTNSIALQIAILLLLFSKWTNRGSLVALTSRYNMGIRGQKQRITSVNFMDVGCTLDVGTLFNLLTYFGGQ